MKATPLWNKLASSNDSLTSSQAKLYLQIFQTDKKEILSKSNQEKYGFSRYRIPLGDSLLFREVVMSITDDDMRAKAIYERSRKWYVQDEAAQAIQYLTWLKGIKLRDKNLADQLLLLNLFLAIETENWDYLKTKLVIDWPQGYINEKIYFEAMLEVYHHQIPAAKLKLNYLASANFQFEEGLLAASNYFVTDTTNRLKPYGILVNGLLAKPNSIKLLKAYTTLADQLGFSEEAQQSNQRLRKLMTPEAFIIYSRKNPVAIP
jgi:hypothetical protein